MKFKTESGRLTAFIKFIFICLLLTATSNVGAQNYYTVTEVLGYFYPKSDKIGYEKLILSTDQAEKISKEIRFPDVKKKWSIYKAQTGNVVDGYIIIDNIIGKEEPITFAVNISPEGQVREVEILVYRESHGGAVKNKAYRKQFVGKSKGDRIRVGKDITHVSGATISSRNIATGVKRVLAVWHVFKK